MEHGNPETFSSLSRMQAALIVRTGHSKLAQDGEDVRRMHFARPAIALAEPDIEEPLQPVVSFVSFLYHSPGWTQRCSRIFGFTHCPTP
jgi:hypothetical protein